MHKYTVEFRITGADLDPAEVSKDLGLVPSLVRRQGEHRSSSSTWDKGLWAFSGSGGLNFRREWDSLEEGLRHVVELLLPLRQKLDKYRGKSDVFFWCGHFQSSMDGGPSFSPGLLKSLAELGFELHLENHFVKPE